MKLNEWYQGAKEPFEGDRTLWLYNLPANAQITRALVTITPVSLDKTKPFEEIIDFTNGGNTLGATKVKADSFIEVDFHARRTLSGLSGSEIKGMTLQVDMGGTYVELSDRGTIKTPGDTKSFELQQDDAPLPGLTLTKFKLNRQPVITQGTSAAGSTASSDLSQVKIRSVPSNLNVRLGQLPAFWTRPGDLTTAATSPDFTQTLNAFLSGAMPENGFYTIPLVIHSDAIARLDVRVQIDYVLFQSALPSYLPEATLPYGFSTLPNGNESLVQVTLPEAAQPLKGRTSALVRGEFKPTRIALGPVGEITKTQPVLVSADCALGQPFRSETEISVTGIDLLFSKTESNLAGLSLSIQSDTDGKPSGTILASADVVVGKPVPPDQSSWGSATLDAPFRVEAHQRYWLVLQSQVGKAYWQTQTRPEATVGLQCRDANGLSWRVITLVGEPSLLEALFRLRNRPDQFTIPLQLQIGRGVDAVRRRLDEFAPLGRIEFQFDFAEKLTEHLEKISPIAPSGTGSIGNLLVNGDFTSPACDDATLKLFDSGELKEARKSVYYESTRFGSIERKTEENHQRQLEKRQDLDLSVERFIVLQVGNGRPVRIDCAGRDPARTAWDEIIAAINRTLGATTLGTAIAQLDSSRRSETIRWKLERPNQSNDFLKLYFWFSSKMPTGWLGTPGRVLRLRHPNRSDRFVVLLADPQDLSQQFLPAINPSADPGLVSAPRSITAETPPPQLPIFPIVPITQGARLDQFSLSQRVSCRPNSIYLFQFIYGVLFSQTSTAPSWQIVWFNAGGQILRIDEKIFNLPAKTDSTSSPVSSFSKLYEVRVTAPSEATQAEIRFVQSSPGGLWLEDISFIPTVETLENATFSLIGEDDFDSMGRFMPIDGDELPHWHRISGWWSLQKKPTVERTDFPYWLVLEGGGVEDSVLSQVAAVIPNAHYALQVNALLELPASNADGNPMMQRSRVELHWLGTSVLSAPIILPLDGLSFPTHAWAGTAPSGATQMELRLVHPKQPGKLLIQSISLQRTDGLSVPLIFLSEAPGELTISNLGVTYDLPEPPVTLNPPEDKIELLKPSAPTPTSTPTSTPAPTPISTSTLLSAPTSAPTFLSTPIPAPISTSTLLSAPTLLSTSTPAPTSTSTPAPISTSTLLSAPTPISTPISAPAPASIPTSTPIPTLLSALTPTSTPAPTPTSTMAPALINFAPTSPPIARSLGVQASGNNSLTSSSTPVATTSPFTINSVRAIALDSTSQLPKDLALDTASETALSPQPAAFPLPANLAGALKNASSASRENMVKGYTLANLKQYEGAIECYSRVIELESNQPVIFAALWLRGEARSHLKDYRGAIADYDQIIQVTPHNGFAYYQRGLTYTALENSQAAIQNFQIASTLFQQQGRLDLYQQTLKQMAKLTNSSGQ